MQLELGGSTELFDFFDLCFISVDFISGSTEFFDFFDLCFISVDFFSE